MKAEQLGRRQSVKRNRVSNRHGRSWLPKPDSEKRAPFASRIPRATKAVSGRTRAPLVPAYILQKVSNKERLDENEKAHIRRKLGMKLGKFARSIERVTIRLTDINGPRGGVDLICRIKVVVSGLPSVVVEEQSYSLSAAVDQALSAVQRTVRRQLQRRRQAPIRQSSRKGRRLVA